MRPEDTRKHPPSPLFSPPFPHAARGRRVGSRISRFLHVVPPAAARWRRRLLFFQHKHLAGVPLIKQIGVLISDLTLLTLGRVKILGLILIELNLIF